MVSFPVTKEVGQRLRDLRLQTGLAEEHLCKKLQMNAGSFSKLEDGMIDIPLWRLAEIAQFFGVDLLDLLITKDNSGIPGLTQEVQFFAKMNLQLAEEIVRLRTKVIKLYSALGGEYRHL
jgi:transcriptional regulator with XRE-family HTH domain